MMMNVNREVARAARKAYINSNLKGKGRSFDSGE